MNGSQFASDAEVTDLGTDWGQRLWRFEHGDRSVDVHADDEAAARTAAAAAFAEIYPEEHEATPEAKQRRARSGGS